MQTIKEKLSDMSAMRKAKAEAKEEEKAEKELAKSRIQVAHEVRMAREAEAEMDHHVNKAAKKVVENERKYTEQGGGGARRQDLHGGDSYMQDSYVLNPSNPGAGYSNDPAYDGAEGGDPYAYGRDTGGIGSAAAAGTGRNMSGGPPTNNDLL